MTEAFLWGLFAASSLVVGGVIAFTLPVGRRTLGFALAFAITLME